MKKRINVLGMIAVSAVLAFAGCAKEHEHSWDEGTVTKEASYNEKGIKEYSCTGCEETKQEEIGALEMTGTRVLTGESEETTMGTPCDALTTVIVDFDNKEAALSIDLTLVVDEDGNKMTFRLVGDEDAYAGLGMNIGKGTVEKKETGIYTAAWKITSADAETGDVVSYDYNIDFSVDAEGEVDAKVSFDGLLAVPVAVTSKLVGSVTMTAESEETTMGTPCDALTTVIVDFDNYKATLSIDLTLVVDEDGNKMTFRLVGDEDAYTGLGMNIGKGSVEMVEDGSYTATWKITSTDAETGEEFSYDYVIAFSVDEYKTCTAVVAFDGLLAAPVSVSSGK